MKRTWLIRIRKTHGTQENISKKIGISRSHYAQIESGDRTPSVKVAKRIARVLGFDWTCFFDNPVHEECNGRKIG